MRVGAVVVGALSLIAGAVLVMSCGSGEDPDTYVCYSDAACPLTMRCVDHQCVCGSFMLERCCSKVDDRPDGLCVKTCMPREFCRGAPELDAGADGSGGAGGVGGSGGLGGSGGSSGGGGVVEAECIADSDCPQPPDKRCGAGTCVNGACSLTVNVGPIASQVHGDCKQLLCDAEGNVVALNDPSDWYEDGRECTYNYCQDGEPKSDPIPSGSVCPVAGMGYCFEGECVECIQGLPGAEDCKDPSFTCDDRWCEPTNLCSDPQACGGLCQPCKIAHACSSDLDCESGNCASGMCQLPTCQDGKVDSEETDVDCGGPLCSPCPAGGWCVMPSDCESDVCVKGKCHAPACTDGKKNGNELGVDCGGSCDPC